MDHTRAAGSNIHHNKLKTPKGVDDRNQPVSATSTLPVTE